MQIFSFVSSLADRQNLGEREINMTTAVANTYQPVKDYYNRALRAAQQQTALSKKGGASAVLLGEDRTAYATRVAAESGKPPADSSKLAPQLVGKAVEVGMAKLGRQTFAEVSNALPTNIQLTATGGLGESLTKHPHLGFIRFGSFTAENDDGTKTTYQLFRSNFRADPRYEDGKLSFANIPPQPDGVKNAGMIFAFAFDERGKMDTRRDASPNLPGMAFRFGEDPKRVAQGCVSLAPKPRAKTPSLLDRANSQMEAVFTKQGGYQHHPGMRTRAYG
ncbi:hypothetical protein [Rhizobium johnstonii]|uniref:hypothetical protein n=1 Tax=Rhizobium johnstonii TaxID=3019933 RepID=UPI003F9C7F19